MLSTPLLSRARYMIMSWLGPTDLKDSEAEWRNTLMHPPIPFVPVKELMDNSTKPKTIKLRVKIGLQMSYLVWAGNTLKALPCHIQLAHRHNWVQGLFYCFQHGKYCMWKGQLKIRETKDQIKEIPLPDTARFKRPMKWKLSGANRSSLRPLAKQKKKDPKCSLCTVLS